MLHIINNISFNWVFLQVPHWCYKHKKIGIKRWECKGSSLASEITSLVSDTATAHKTCTDNLSWNAEQYVSLSAQALRNR